MSITQRVTELEKTFGRGATYSRQQREEILAGICPEWLLRCELLLKGDDKAWATKLVQGLRKAREELWSKVRFSETETTPPVAENKPGAY